MTQAAVQERKPVKYPYITGFCSNSSHEGSALISEKGTRLRACSGEFTIQGKAYHCGCDCHEAFRQIAAITGLTTKNVGSGALIAPVLLEDEETPTDVPNPEETPDTAILDVQELPPTVPMSGVSSLPDVPETTLVPASATAGRVATVQYRASAPTVPGGCQWDTNGDGDCGRTTCARCNPQNQPRPGPVFQATPTGRRARGELEADVLRFLKDWFTPVAGGGPVTPKMISLALPGQPSQGAIYAVIKKYEGTRAAVAEKPFRVVGFK